jgi:hypothetical protein
MFCPRQKKSPALSESEVHQYLYIPIYTSGGGVERGEGRGRERGEGKGEREQKCGGLYF